MGFRQDRVCTKISRNEEQIAGRLPRKAWDVSRGDRQVARNNAPHFQCAQGWLSMHGAAAVHSIGRFTSFAAAGDLPVAPTRFIGLIE